MALSSLPQMNHHNKVIINNDPNNLSHLSAEVKMQIEMLQSQIDEIRARPAKKHAFSGYEIFENKNFNEMKVKLMHQTTQEIKDLIYSKWQFQLD